MLGKGTLRCEGNGMITEKHCHWIVCQIGRCQNIVVSKLSVFRKRDHAFEVERLDLYGTALKGRFG